MGGYREVLYQHPKRSARLVEEAFGTDLVGGDELVVFFFDELHLFAVERQLEHWDHVASHELRCYGAAGEAPEFLPAAGDVWRGLYDAQTIVPPLAFTGSANRLPFLLTPTYTSSISICESSYLSSQLFSRPILLMLVNIFNVCYCFSSVLCRER